MTTIRLMTYNVQRCRGTDGRTDPERVLQVIADAAPDIVALQDMDTSGEGEHLQKFALRLGMRPYGHGSGGNAFLSYYPLRGVQEYALGSGGCCQRADADVHGRRLHLFNIRLTQTLQGRGREIEALLGPQLLGHNSLCSPLLLLGDFGDTFWAPGNMSLTLVLRKARRPLWSSTYPARFPLIGRDRAYLRGDIRIVDSSIPRSAAARQASSHLPLVMTVQVRDPGSYLRVEKPIGAGKMEIAPG